MNDRVKELAEKAGMTDDKYGMFFAKEKHNEDGVDLQKFSELLVWECAKFLEDNSGYDQSNNSWHPEPEDLLQHFGVK